MNDRIKDIVVTISFLFVIIVILIANLIKADTEFSINELLTGNFFEKFEKYSMDQFVRREALRSLKTNIEMKVLKKQDSNNIYEYDQKLIEQIYPLNEKSIMNITNKMNEIYQSYFDETNEIYYTIVPDKNYFVNNNHLKYLIV